MCSNFFFAKAKRFYFFQKFWNKPNFGTNPKLFDVFQLLFSKSKTFLYNSKIFRSERERFGLIMNLVSKTNIFDFFRDVSRKMKANDLWFDITSLDEEDSAGSDLCATLR